jgi:hypothetical protein
MISSERMRLDHSRRVTARRQWIGPVIIVALCYALVGVATAALAKPASPEMRSVWRATAWLLSLAAFAGHVAYEQLRLRTGVRTTAIHAAVAVALGAFLLAAAGPVRSHWGMADFWRSSVLSLALWPLLTGIPAFLAALVGAFVVARLVVRHR